MAKQVGIIPITGTIDNLTFYELNGKYYVRKKSSLSGKRVKTNACFSNTRRNAKWFAEAVRLTKQVYYELLFTFPNRFSIWHPMRNRAQQLVREGMPGTEIILLLRKEFIEPLRKKYFTEVIVKPQPVAKEFSLEIPTTKIVSPIAISKDAELLIDRLAASNSFVNTILPRNNKLRDQKRKIDRK